MSACEEWAEYVLEAKVMLIRAADGSFRPIESSLTFREWMEAGHELGYPAADDLEYHMTTLFPPVRPRGWLELRMIDALPDPLWVVPLAVAAGLLLEPEGREQATAACAPAAGRWLDAMCSGLADAVLAACAERCFDVADGALARLGVAGPTRAAVSDYAERYVARRRTPADDRLDLWSETGALLPGNATVPAAPGAVQG
jgi:glutamate--cysteine ligase